jgi:hypothetical protein
MYISEQLLDPTERRLRLSTSFALGYTRALLQAAGVPGNGPHR